MVNHPDSHPSLGSPHPLRRSPRGSAGRGELRRLSRIPAMRGSLPGPSGRFAQRIRSDNG